MKKIVFRLFSKPIFLFLRIFAGKAFSNPLFNPFTMLKCFFWQKILRINSHVPWPVHWSSEIKSPEKIQKGTRNPGLSMGCYFDGRNGIEIGENTWMGPRVSLISMNHDVNDYTRYIKTNPIKIGRDCWIGTGAIILPGVELGNHVIIAAGSVVTKSFKEDNILLAGVPARIIKRLGNYSRSEDVT